MNDLMLDREELQTIRNLVGELLAAHLRNYEMMNNIMVTKPWMYDAIAEYQEHMALHDKLTEMLKEG